MMDIGIVIGGPDGIDQDQRDLMMSTMRWLGEHGTESDDGLISPSVDVIFDFPGSVRKPEWKGFMVGRFFRKLGRLQLAFAVPERAFTGEEFKQFIVSTLKEAAQLGAEVLKRKKVTYDFEAAMELISELESYLAPM